MYIKAKVAPGAKKSSITRTAPDAFDVSVREPAERNLANQAVRELLATAFGVPVGKVRLIAGHRSRSKIFDVAV